MTFFLIAFIGMYIGRKVGWFFSKTILYECSLPMCRVMVFLWGILIAYLIHLLFQWQNPGLILKIIMGYSLGVYVAIPNYGLLVESSIPPSEILRHQLIGKIPIVTYILASILFAFL